MKLLLIETRVQTSEYEPELEILNTQLLNSLDEARAEVEESFEEEMEYYAEDEDTIEEERENLVINTQMNESSLSIGIGQELASYDNGGFDYRTLINWTVVRVE